MTGTNISNVKIGTIDTTAPAAVSGASGACRRRSKTRVDLQWAAAADEDGGLGGDGVSGVAGRSVAGDDGGDAVHG